MDTNLFNAKKGDFVYLKAMSIPGFVCVNNFVCIFDIIKEDKIVCRLPGASKFFHDQIAYINVPPRYVSFICDQFTSSIIYRSDPATGL